MDESKLLTMHLFVCVHVCVCVCVCVCEREFKYEGMQKWLTSTYCTISFVACVAATDVRAGRVGAGGFCITRWAYGTFIYIWKKIITKCLKYQKLQFSSHTMQSWYIIN